MRRVLTETAALMVAACALALLSGTLRRPPVPLRLPADFYRLESGARPLTLPQAERALLAGGSVFVDIRPESEFVAGHIPGSLHLPADRYRDLIHDLSGWIEGVPSVLYGGDGDAATADDIAAVLQEFGYRELSVFVDGYPAWVAAGLPMETGRFGVLDVQQEGFEGEEWSDDPSESGTDEMPDPSSDESPGESEQEED